MYGLRCSRKFSPRSPLRASFKVDALIYVRILSWYGENTNLITKFICLGFVMSKIGFVGEEFATEENFMIWFWGAKAVKYFYEIFCMRGNFENYY